MPNTAENFLLAWSKYAPTVIFGTTVRRDSARTAKRCALFSDWEVRVTRVFKNASPIPVEEGDTITVAQIGGTVVENGRVYVYSSPDIPTYGLNGTYVLFLLANPESASFESISDSAVDVTDKALRILRNPKGPVKPAEWEKTLTSEEFLALAERTIIP